MRNRHGQVREAWWVTFRLPGKGKSGVSVLGHPKIARRWNGVIRALLKQNEEMTAVTPSVSTILKEN